MTSKISLAQIFFSENFYKYIHNFSTLARNILRPKKHSPNH